MSVIPRQRLRSRSGSQPLSAAPAPRYHPGESVRLQRASPEASLEGVVFSSRL